MISDALMAKGTPIGSEYIFGGNHITIYPDGSAHLDNGTLACSTLNINKGLRILVEEAMVPFNYALNACTINPARCLHLDDRKGSIQIGKGCRPCGAERQLRCAADLLHGQGPAVISG